MKDGTYVTHHSNQPVKTDTSVWFCCRNFSLEDCECAAGAAKLPMGLTLALLPLPDGLRELPPIPTVLSPCSWALWMASKACWVKRLSQMLHTCTASLFFHTADDIDVANGDADGWGTAGLRDFRVSLLWEDGRGDLVWVRLDKTEVEESASSLMLTLFSELEAGERRAATAALVSASACSVCMCWSRRYSMWNACSHMVQRNGLLWVVRWHCSSISLVKLSAQNKQRYGLARWRWFTLTCTLRTGKALELLLIHRCY